MYHPEVSGLVLIHVLVTTISRGRGARTEGTEHGPAGVDDLDLAVAGEGLRVGRQTRCVPAVVT